jgi:hypothetical protein
MLPPSIQPADRIDSRWLDESLRDRRVFARRKPNQHADPVCLLHLLGNRRDRAERYGTCNTNQEFAPSRYFSRSHLGVHA